MATTSPAADRIFSLDAIRGVAVMGIFSVNVIAFAMIEVAYFNPAAYGGHHGVDLLVWATNMLVIDGKMRSLFSMLFGASMLLVIDRAEASGQSGAKVHYRRMAVLFLFGFVHYFFVWFGDILALYALSGMIAFAGRKADPRTLVILAVVMLGLHLLIFGGFIASQYQVDQAAHAAGAAQATIREWNEGLGGFFPNADQLSRDLAVHRGSWIDISGDKLRHWGQFIGSNLVFIPDTVGLMFLGMAGYKSGFLTGQWEDRRYRTVAAILIPLGMACAGGLVATDLSTGFYVVAMMAGFVAVSTPFITAQALGYAALIILLTRKRGELATRIAAAGRCAFTNYLGTSLIATFVFYGWGLGFYGSASRAQAWLLVPIVWTAMLLWSKPWLARFRYGPMEWLWRSLSRGSLQPMRKAAAAA